MGRSARTGADHRTHMDDGPRLGESVLEEVGGPQVQHREAVDRVQHGLHALQALDDPGARGEVGPHAAEAHRPREAGLSDRFRHRRRVRHLPGGVVRGLSVDGHHEVGGVGALEGPREEAGVAAVPLEKDGTPAHQLLRLPRAPADDADGVSLLEQPECDGPTGVPGRARDRVRGHGIISFVLRSGRESRPTRASASERRGSSGSRGARGCTRAGRAAQAPGRRRPCPCPRPPSRTAR